MGRFKIKQTAKGFTVFFLKYVGGGYVWETTGRHFPCKEAAQAFIEAERAVKSESRE